MADSNYNPADNLSQEDRIKGGQNSPAQFGKPQGADPAEAGRMSSGNTGNSEQHAEAGRQSHKND